MTDGEYGKKIITLIHILIIFQCRVITSMASDGVVTLAGWKILDRACFPLDLKKMPRWLLLMVGSLST